jgi:hypothetical protein
MKFALDQSGRFPVPSFFQEEAVAERLAVSSDRGWQILSFQECAAPEGAAEHGRWHAAVVRVVQRNQG